MKSCDLIICRKTEPIYGLQMSFPSEFRVRLRPCFFLTSSETEQRKRGNLLGEGEMCQYRMSKCCSKTLFLKENKSITRFSVRRSVSSFVAAPHNKKGRRTYTQSTTQYADLKKKEIITRRRKESKRSRQLASSSIRTKGLVTVSTSHDIHTPRRRLYTSNIVECILLCVHLCTASAYTHQRKRKSKEVVAAAIIVESVRRCVW